MTLFFALDYDGTYTAAPAIWDDFIRRVLGEGHKIAVVTWRYNNASDAPPVMAVAHKHGISAYFTGSKAKRLFMTNLGVHVDIWIDDKPESVVFDGWLTRGPRAPSDPKNWMCNIL